jgi:hypothetical protein
MQILKEAMRLLSKVGLGELLYLRVLQGSQNIDNSLF